MTRMSGFLVLLPLLASGCGVASDPHKAVVETVLVVLGNEPLDDDTPTVDTVARVGKAVAFAKEHPHTLLLFTGGPTAGEVSEARMMAALAAAQGISTNAIRLEEKARSTRENAELSARIVAEAAPRRVYIVSKQSHLNWAMPIFRKLDVFRAAEPLPSQISRAESIAQMAEYLKTHDSERVRERWIQLKNGVSGTD